jgi:hypothetical protein
VPAAQQRLDQRRTDRAGATKHQQLQVLLRCNYCSGADSMPDTVSALGNAGQSG